MKRVIAASYDDYYRVRYGNIYVDNIRFSVEYTLPKYNMEKIQIDMWEDVEYGYKNPDYVWATVGDTIGNTVPPLQVRFIYNAKEIDSIHLPSFYDGTWDNELQYAYAMFEIIGKELIRLNRTAKQKKTP